MSAITLTGDTDATLRLILRTAIIGERALTLTLATGQRWVVSPHQLTPEGYLVGEVGDGAQVAFRLADITALHVLDLVEGDDDDAC